MSRRVLFVLATLLAIQAWIAAPAEAVKCGDAGQVACINTDLTYATPYHGCNTDRLNNRLNICGACGGVGQPTCDFGNTCDVGSENVFGICTYRGHSDEPTTGVSVMPTLVQPATGPVRGIADVHTHMFSNLGFGGILFWGAPYHPGGIDEALPWCDYSWKYPTTIAYSGAPGPQVPFLGYEIHGPKSLQAIDDPISLGLEEGQHAVDGTGNFSGWPTYLTMTHQQMYYKWVERAYLGGIRLMVVHALSSEALCSAGKRRTDFTCNDMDAVDKQIQAAKDLETAIDKMDDGKVNHSGWYQIAYTPTQARELIRNGKMAVVLGIEVDSLFNCKYGQPCTTDHIKSQLKKYYDLGVRHVFPIHQYDNAFGGAAIFNDILNSGNRVISGHHFEVRDCSAEGYTYNVHTNLPTDFLAWVLHGADFPSQTYYDQFAADCNALGLSETGTALINAMMDDGFIIDVDHMSRLMLDEALMIAQSRHYPMVSGHSNLRGGQGGSEFSLTDGQMAILKQVGGMVTAISPKGTCGTSADFAYHYLHAVQGMEASPGDPYAAVAFSTDMNGFAGATGPRFGNPDCPGKAGTELQYPFQGIMGGTFNKQVTGGRTFDFNYDGMAQYGLIADFFADLKNTGLTDDQLQPLLNSAESYIRLWERVNPNASELTVEPVLSGNLGSNGYYTSKVHLSWQVSGTPGVDVELSDGCQDQDITQDTQGKTFTCNADAYFSLPGHSHIVLGSAQKSVTIKRDTTPPTITWGAASPAANANGWHNTNVSLAFTLNDAGSGVASGHTASPLVFTTEGTGRTATVTATDFAGNTAIFRSPAVNIDKTAPAISFVSRVPAANGAGWNRTNPTVTWQCTDALSGAAAAQVSQTLTTEGAGQSLTGRCADLAGNTAYDTRAGFNVDKTPPTLNWAAAAPAANAAGWHNTDVALPFAAADALSGVAGTSHASPLTFAAEGRGVTQTITVTDVAGNTATFTSPAVNIDKTAPAIAFVSHLPAANAAGWNREAPTLTWQCTDGLSGSAAAQVSRILTTEGAGQSLTGQCTDLAGNAASDTRAGLNFDKTPPTLDWAAASPVANANGWHNTNVALAFTPADTLSGVASTSQASPLVLTTEGTAVTGMVSVTDVAGNTATFTSSPVRIDKTDPAIAFVSHLPAVNAAGWNREDPTLTWQCTDGLSGPTAAQVSRTLTTEGTGQSLTGQCTDLAGNAVSDTRTGLNLDKTLPTLTWAAAVPAANANGWHNTDVTLAFTPADALSGVAGTSQPSPLVLTTEGAAVTGVVSVTDVAGNTATFTSPFARIDKTPPLVSCTADKPVLWPPNNKLVPVSVDLSLSDALSGGVTYVMNEATSSERDARRDIVGFTVPGTALSGALRAERSGRGTGLVYTLGYQGTDLAGNSATCSTVVIVPHDRDEKKDEKKGEERGEEKGGKKHEEKGVKGREDKGGKKREEKGGQ